MVLKGVVSGSTIDFGADNDSFTLSVAATSTTILVAPVQTHLSSPEQISSVSGGADGDSLVFSAVVKSASSVQVVEATSPGV